MRKHGLERIKLHSHKKLLVRGQDPFDSSADCKRVGVNIIKTSMKSLHKICAEFQTHTNYSDSGIDNHSKIASHSSDFVARLSGGRRQCHQSRFSLPWLHGLREPILLGTACDMTVQRCFRAEQRRKATIVRLLRFSWNARFRHSNICPVARLRLVGFYDKNGYNFFEKATTTLYSSDDASLYIL